MKFTAKWKERSELQLSTITVPIVGLLVMIGRAIWPQHEELIAKAAEGAVGLVAAYIVSRGIAKAGGPPRGETPAKPESAPES